MVRVIVFNVLFLFAIGYALARGKRPERTVALTFVGARIATDVMLGIGGSYYHHGPEYGATLVDCVTFAILLWVSLRSDRFWPLLIVAMQGVSLLAHLGKLMAYDIRQNTYLNSVQLWAYPQLLLLAIGTARVDLRAWQKRAGWWPMKRTDLR